MKFSWPTWSPRTRRLLGIGVVVLLLGWLTFFDSHSLLRRGQWQYEHARLQEENARLRAEIARLDSLNRAGLTDEMIERIAREEFGMRRPGETVHPVTEPEE